MQAERKWSLGFSGREVFLQISHTVFVRFAIAMVSSLKSEADYAAMFQPEVSEAQRDLDAVIEELDTKLDRQLKKQEHDYLKGYSIYVKTKEKELKTLI